MLKKLLVGVGLSPLLAVAAIAAPPAAFGYVNEWVGNVYNRTFQYDPCYTSGVPNEDVSSQSCPSHEAPPQYHNWSEAENLDFGTVNVYPAIQVRGSSNVERGTWSVEYEVEPGTGIYVPNLGVSKYWPVIGLIGQSNSNGYRVHMYGWLQ